MVQGKITEADTLTVPLGATPSELISEPPPSSPHFYAGCPSCRNHPNLSLLGTGTGICWIAYPRGLVIPPWLGDFIIHITNPNDHLTCQVLSLLSSFNRTQHVNFPIHNKNLFQLFTCCVFLCHSLPSTSSFSSFYQALYKYNTTPSSKSSLFPPISLYRYWFYLRT